MRSYGDSFDDVCEQIIADLSMALDVHVGEWQAIKGNIPQAETIEIEDVSFDISLPLEVHEWQEIIKPNMPWAEEHFQERVSGIPHNPPPSHVRWPFAQKSNEEHMNGEKFSHTYPERFWPKWASDDAFSVMGGIRYPYGDLNDVVRLLKERPGTRQAYLPVWFPEDTGAVADQRVPCTLGYHFLIRNGKLKIVYYIRSCDFYRHFRDDAYMAGRLGQWVSDQLHEVVPGKLVMHISSMHIFSAERGRIEAESRK
jgi:hypothetical protein